MKFQRLVRGPFLWITLLLVLAVAMISTLSGVDDPEELTYGEFLQALDDDEVATATILSRDSQHHG